MPNQTKKESVCGYCKQPFRGGTLCPHTLNQTKPKNQCSFNHRELPNCKVCEKLGCNHEKEQGVEKTIGQMKIATFGLKEELKDFPDIMEVISAQISKARQEERAKTLEEIEGLRDSLICGGVNGCGGKPPFNPEQQVVCGSNFECHFILESKYDILSQVLSILKK